MQFITFEPIYQERVWGGSLFRTSLGRNLPPGGPFGESWDVVDRPEACSIVKDGFGAGRTLRDLRSNHAEQLMGPGWPKDRPFPILVKWLDCRARLSLQVHPPAAKAASLGGEPKTENWYVAEATPEATLLAGLRPGTTRESFVQALRGGGPPLENLVNRLPLKAGDSFFVPSGRLHALEAGSLILEIQQNSDTTYRVYDWGRMGLDGKPRHLHIEESLASIDFQDHHPAILQTTEQPGQILLAAAPEFRLTKCVFRTGQSYAWQAGEQPRLIHVVYGSLRSESEGREWRSGETVLLPYCSNGSLTAVQPSAFLLTDCFHHV